jgi:ferredoxin/flavodoxin
MIFYFSGTGNSLYAAKTIGNYNNERLISIASAMKNVKDFNEYNLEKDEVIGFVFPIYAWAPPKMVLEFIDKIKFNNYNNNYIFAVATCGGNIGNTMKIMSNCLKTKNLPLNSAFSIVMPNNYIIIGDVDSKVNEDTKLNNAEESLKGINTVIKGRKAEVFKLEKGICPFLMTALINPLFNKNAIKPNKFFAKETCTSCGICEKVCNCNNIKVATKPKWGSRCIQCLACLNYCPVQAIQYGKNTKNKGRYRNPNIKIDEMFIK